MAPSVRTPKRRRGTAAAVTSADLLATRGPERRRWFAALRTVAGLTLLSRVLGMLRDVATASLFGLGGVMDAFVVAFRIPNALRRFFGEGALAASFLPVFSRQYHQSGPRAAWTLASTLLVLLASGLTLLVLAGLGVCYVLWQVAGGHPQTSLLLGLTATLLPFMIFVCLAAQLSAMLQTLDRFTLPALAPALMNLCWLVTVVLIAPAVATEPPAQAYVLAAGLVVAMALQVVLQYRGLNRLGFRFQPAWHASRDALRSIVRDLAPMVLGLAAVQINALADSVVAWLLARPEGGGATFELFGMRIAYPMQSGAAAGLYFAERLYQFPLGVFGVALGTVIYPLLTRHAAEGRFEALRHDLVRGLQLVLAIGIPAGVGLAALAAPAVDAIFQHGQFTAEHAARAARVVAGYAVGVWAYCALLVLVRAFYATGHRRAPVRVGAAAVLFNFALGMALIWPLAEAGLALATAASATLQVALLARRLPEVIGSLPWRTLADTFVRSTLGSAAMLVVVMVAPAWLPVGETFSLRLERLAVLLVLGVVSYAAVGYALGLRKVLSIAA